MTKFRNTYRDQTLSLAEVQSVIGTAHDIHFKLEAHKDEMHLWSLQDIISLLTKGYSRDEIIAGFTRPVFAD